MNAGHFREELCASNVIGLPGPRSPQSRIRLPALSVLPGPNPSEQEMLTSHNSAAAEEQVYGLNRPTAR